MSPVPRQVITWANDGSLSVGPSGRLSMSFKSNWKEFHSGLNMLENIVYKRATILSRPQFVHIISICILAQTVSYVV